MLGCGGGKGKLGRMCWGKCVWGVGNVLGWRECKGGGGASKFGEKCGKVC